MNGHPGHEMRCGTLARKPQRTSCTGSDSDDLMHTRTQRSRDSATSKAGWGTWLNSGAIASRHKLRGNRCEKSIGNETQGRPCTRCCRSAGFGPAASSARPWQSSHCNAYGVNVGWKLLGLEQMKMGTNNSVTSSSNRSVGRAGSS